MAELSTAQWVYYPIICIVLVLLAGIYSGLSLGLFSIDVMYLRVLSTTGTEVEQKRAKKLLPLLERQHLTLVTVLICNAAAMTALPIFLEAMVSPVLSIILSVTAILAFGEVIPQSTFVKYAMPIGSFFAPFVWLSIGVTFIVSWPIGKLLDFIVGHKTEVMEREQLGEFLQLHSEAHADAAAKLSAAEVNVMRGAMALSSMKVCDLVKVGVDDIYSLSSSAVLDKATIEDILHTGYSRIPVHRDDNKRHILGVLLVKSLLPLAYTNPDPPPRVGAYHLREVLRISEDSMVENVYASFQSGQSHMAVVYNVRGILSGILTLEEVFEALHSVSIQDETDLRSNKAARKGDQRQRQMLEVLATAKMDITNKSKEEK